MAEREETDSEKVKKNLEEIEKIVYEQRFKLEEIDKIILDKKFWSSGVNFTAEEKVEKIKEILEK